jgi:hypothetical protein
LVEISLTGGLAGGFALGGLAGEAGWRACTPADGGY